MYCVLGGVPLYWSLIDYTKIAVENIDLMFFAESPIFEGVYKKIMGSVFKNPGNYLKLIDLLCKRKSGMTRTEITVKTVLTGSHLTELLDNLEGCNFVRGFDSGKKTKDNIWQVIDPFIILLSSVFTL